MVRNIEYYDKQTSMHVNNELHDVATKFGKKNGTYFYVIVDNAVREYLKKKGIKLPSKEIIS